MEAMAYNKVILMGNLVETPELRQTASGLSVTNFRLAVSRRQKAEGQPDTDFFTIVAWRGTAEFITKYFTKGRGILVSGQLQARPWTDNDGNKRTAIEVVADEVSFCDKKSEGQNTPSNDAPSLMESIVPAADYDDDMPF